MNLPNVQNRHTGLAQVLWGNPEDIGIERDVPVLFAALFIYSVAGAQTSQKMEEKKEMKDTVIVDGKLVEVGYKIIADGVTDGNLDDAICTTKRCTVCTGACRA